MIARATYPEMCAFIDSEDRKDVWLIIRAIAELYKETIFLFLYKVRKSS